MQSPSRIKTNLFSITSRIQVRDLLPCKGNIPHAFRLKPTHNNMSRPTGPWAFVIRLTCMGHHQVARLMSRHTSEPPDL